LIGSKLGPYESLEQLGAGGMGEVYLAKDTRLGRQVAIKVLPADFAHDPERLARFEQEARAAAALNHPHIAVVHDVGSENDDDGKPIHFMVQEHLEGDSLKGRLEIEPLPLDKALGLAVEIAEALTAAHGGGIVHRDLKPDNIFVSTSGHAKVLDFGLAKLVEGMASGATGMSLSPTVLGTVAGQIMGTAGYMAPEQVEGVVDIDQRADLFAFGCVLYEMTTGTRAFGAATALDTLHKIVHSEPQSLTDFAADMPADMQRILKKCLAKDRDRRYQSAEDVVVDLRQLRDDIAAGVAPSVAESNVESSGPVTAGWSTAALVASTLGAAAVMGLVAWMVLRPAPARPAPLVDFTISLPDGVDFTNGGRRLVAFSPDGTRIVFVANAQLFTRRMGETEITPLRGSEGDRFVVSPFFSPDGNDIAFFADYDLRRVEASGGPARVLSSFDGLFEYGGSWGRDGNLYVALSDLEGTSGIWRIPENGGEAVQVVELEGEIARAPQLLPDNESLLFTLAESPQEWSDAAVVVQSLRTGDRRELFRPGSDAQYLPTGHIVYANGYTLFARAFDAGRLVVGAEAAPVREEVRQSITGRTASGASQWAVSDLGGLVYRAGSAATSAVGMTWYSVAGQTDPLPLPGIDGDLYEPRLSPDGDRIAVRNIDEETSQILVYDIDQKNFQLFATSGEGPLWAPDGASLYYTGTGGDDADIYRGRVSSSLSPEPVLVRAGQQFVTDVTQDRLLFTEWEDDSRESADIWTLSLEEGAEPELVVGGPAHTRAAVFSPDGTWIAYTSNETGSTEIWAQEYPGPGVKLKVSGGENASYPQWLDSGIFYHNQWRWAFVEDLDPGSAFDPAPPRILGDKLRRTRGHRGFDVPPDGQRVLVNRAEDAGSAPSRSDELRVVLNWFDEIKQKVPPQR